MDPNQVLQELREAVADLQYEVEDGGDLASLGLTSEALIEKVVALDSWLSRGGLLPEDWSLRQDALTSSGGLTNPGITRPLGCGT